MQFIILYSFLSVFAIIIFVIMITSFKKKFIPIPILFKCVAVEETFQGFNNSKFKDKNKEKIYNDIVKSLGIIEIIPSSNKINGEKFESKICKAIWIGKKDGKQYKVFSILKETDNVNKMIGRETVFYLYPDGKIREDI